MVNLWNAVYKDWDAIGPENLAEIIRIAIDRVERKETAQLLIITNEVLKGKEYADHKTLDRIARRISSTGQYIIIRADTDFDIRIARNPEWPMINSVIQTNNSMQEMNNITLPRSFRHQRNSNISNFGLALISVIFIGISAYKQATSKTDMELANIKTTLDSMKTILKRQATNQVVPQNEFKQDTAYSNQRVKAELLNKFDNHQR